MAGVKIQTSTGQYGTVDEKDLQQAIDAGATQVSDDEFAKAAAQKEFGGVGGMAAAGGLGLARGATLGLSDLAATAIGGEETRRTIEGYKEANPFASGTGEVAGMLAPLVFSGGASGAVEGAEGASLAARGIRALGAPVRGIDALGGLAERGVARIVGTGAESVLGRGLQRGVALGARSAVEGAAYGAFQQLDEDVLGNKEIAAQKLWAAAEKGAIFSGLLGGGIGFAGGAGGALLGKGKSALAKRLGSVGLREAAEKESAEFAFRAGGGGKKIATKAEKYAGGTDAVGRIWRDEAPELAGKQSIGKMAREDYAIAAQKGMTREGEAIDGILTRVDESAQKAGKVPTIGDLLADVERVKGSVLKHAGQEPLVARLDDFGESMKRLTGAVAEDGTLNLQQPVSFKQWQALRRDADKMWGEAAKGGKTVFLDLRGEMENSMVQRIEAMGEGKAYGAAKKRWQAFKLLDDATKNATAASGSNRFWSLTDTISGSAGATIGGMVGGLPGSIVGGAISGAINRAVRTRGDFVMSEALHRLSNVEKAQAITKMFDSRVEKAVSGLLSRGKSVAFGLGSAAASRPSKRDDMAIARAVHELAANPDLMQRRLQEHAPDLQRDMKGVAAQYGLVANRAIQYMAEHAPKQKSPASLLQPQFSDPYRMSGLEKSKWRSVVKGALETDTVIDEIESGRIDRHAIEAIKYTQPHVFDQLRQEVLRQSAELEKRLPIQKQAALSNAFDVPVGSMFTPEAIAAYQATYAPAEAMQEQMPSPSPKEAGDRAKKLRSPTEEVAYDE